MCTLVKQGVSDRTALCCPLQTSNPNNTPVSLSFFFVGQPYPQKVQVRYSKQGAQAHCNNQTAVMQQPKAVQTLVCKIYMHTPSTAAPLLHCQYCSQQLSTSSITTAIAWQHRYLRF
jgi:aspartate carbamoyltransferase regulatory subunit